MATKEYQQRMTARQLYGYLNDNLLSWGQSVKSAYPNPWTAYEAAKRLVKTNLCNNGPDGFDWQLYDYYQPMIVDWSGVYK